MSAGKSEHAWLTEQLEAANKAASEAVSENHRLRRELSELNAEAVQINAMHDAALAERDTLKAELQEANKWRDRLADKIIELEQQMREQALAVEDKLQHRDTLKSENALLHQRCERMEREAKSLLGENERLRAECVEAESDAEAGYEARDQLRELREAAIEYMDAHEEGAMEIYEAARSLREVVERTASGEPSRVHQGAAADHRADHIDGAAVLAQLNELREAADDACVETDDLGVHMDKIARLRAVLAKVRP